MQKIVTQIRNLEAIEKELNSNFIGSLAIISDEEKIVQYPSPYLYIDKNLYLFFNKDSELYGNITNEQYASFNVINQGKPSKSDKADFNPTYTFTSISIMGALKKVDEQKVMDEMRKNFFKKYSQKNTATKKDITTLHYVVMIDTEEISAFEETGG